MNKKSLLIIYFLFVICYSSFAQWCNVIYVTPGGASSGAAGTPVNPANLTYGLSLVTPTANQLWLATGTYTISDTLTIRSNLTIEGGFNPITWAKSNGTPSIISRNTNNISGPPANALIGLMAINASGFRLQDLTVTVANAPGNQISVYGIYLQNCSNYNITRCEVTTGSGSAGIAGTPGTPGTAGGNGFPGAPGTLEPGPINGGAGGSGAFTGGNGANVTSYNPSASGNGAAGGGPCGGAGGAGGTGPSCSAGCFFGPPSCSSTTAGQPGQPGGNGTTGITGITGIAGTIAVGYFVPGGIGGIGGNGTNGCGGGGGGAGGGRQENGADDWGGSGGGGGGGGGGATGGTGGNGGGGSFAIFLYNNGTGGIIHDCFLNPGPGGAGGSGGSGGSGGTGGNGGAGGPAGVCGNGVGGNGGKGGDGGSGGNGGNGAAGPSVALSENGGTLVTQTGITVVPGNPPVITVLNHGCTNAEVIFTAASSGTWNFGAGASPATALGAGPFSVFYSSLGRKTITFSGTAFGDFVNIFQNGPALPAVSPANSTLAAGCPGFFTTTLAGIYYQWYFPPSAGPDSVVGATAQNADSIYFSTPGTYTIYVYVTTPCCGRIKDSTTITIIPSALNVSLNPSPASVCTGSSLTFTASPSGYVNYQFFINGNSMQNGSGNTYSTSALQNGDSVLVIVSNGTCYNASSAVVVTVHPLPVVTISSQTNVSCFGWSNGIATATVSIGTSPFTYLWNTASQTTQTATGLAAGNYSVTVTDANGCIGTQTVAITQPAALTAPITSSNVLCFGGNNGTATVNPGGGTPGYSYIWLPSGNSQTITGLSAGTYYVVVTDVNNCTTTSSVVITQPAALNSSLSSANAGCQMSNGTSTAAAAGGTLPYTYLWSNGQTTSTATGLAQGNYSVTITDANGCTFGDTISVFENPPPVATIIGNTSICIGQNITLTAMGGNSFLWSNSQTSSSIVVSPSVATNYSVIVTSGNCTDDTSVNVLVNPLPVVNAGNDVTISLGSNTQLNASGGISYNWFPSNSLNCGNCQNPIASPPATTNYIVYVSDASGCVNSDTINVFVDLTCKDIYLPNAFSPNGDGDNDDLKLYTYNLYCITDFKIVIFDRWGEKVFESSDPNFRWDGKYTRGLFSGEEGSAVFVYILKAEMINGEKISRRGNISLIR